MKELKYYPIQLIKAQPSHIHLTKQDKNRPFISNSAKPSIQNERRRIWTLEMNQ